MPFFIFMKADKSSNIARESVSLRENVADVDRTTYSRESTFPTMASAIDTPTGPKVAAAGAGSSHTSPR
jgi:hypothetical protein